MLKNFNHRAQVSANHGLWAYLTGRLAEQLSCAYLLRNEVNVPRMQLGLS
jgi:hypothetical protein